MLYTPKICRLKKYSVSCKPSENSFGALKPFDVKNDGNGKTSDTGNTETMDLAQAMNLVIKGIKAMQVEQSSPLGQQLALLELTAASSASAEREPRHTRMARAAKELESATKQHEQHEKQ